MGNTPTAKQPYSTPQLVVYGNLRVVTQAKTKKGSDGGTGSSQYSI